MSKFAKILEQIVTFGLGEKLLRYTTHQDGIKCVAAGDPALPGAQTESNLPVLQFIEVDGRRMDLSQLESFRVCGNSMLPQDIADGDCLFVRQLPAEQYQAGDFLVIQVDEDYYRKYKPKTLVYSYKLRRALLRLEPGVGNDEMISRLKELDNAAYLEDMQRYAIRKYQKARQVYPDRELMLSTTYHDGELKYSFHPIDLVYGKAVIVYSGGKARFLDAA